MRWTHHEPLYWLLFGAGGMITAIAMPAVILIVGILWPLGLLAEGSHAEALALAGHPLGRLIVAAGLSLTLWHAAHRVYHGLHDVGLRRGPLAWSLTYGLAAAGTLSTVVLVIAL